jgi:NADPH:quinone reductase
MRAIMLESFDSSPALREVPTPQIAPNEVLVRVRASSVNPVDGAIAAGMMSAMVEHEFPVVLGRDYAGVVEQAGSDVTRYAEGEEVYGFLPAANPNVHDGTWAELIVVPEDNFVARKPAGVELAEAGAAPLSGITALSALDVLGASEDETVLVLVSYAPEGFDTHAEVLKDDGRGASSLSAAGEGSERHNVMAMPTQDNLERLGRLLEAGTLRVPIQSTYGLDLAGEALGALATAHTQGKLAIQVA